MYIKRQFKDTTSVDEQLPCGELLPPVREPVVISRKVIGPEAYFVNVPCIEYYEIESAGFTTVPTPPPHPDEDVGELTLIPIDSNPTADRVQITAVADYANNQAICYVIGWGDLLGMNGDSFECTAICRLVE